MSDVDCTDSTLYGNSDRPTSRDTFVGIAAERVHDMWVKNKRAQGFVSRRSETGEELMVPYDQLSDRQKDVDRATVAATVSVLNTVGVLVVAKEESSGRAVPPMRVEDIVQQVIDAAVPAVYNADDYEYVATVDYAGRLQPDGKPHLDNCWPRYEEIARAAAASTLRTLLDALSCQPAAGYGIGELAALLQKIEAD